MNHRYLLRIAVAIGVIVMLWLVFRMLKPTEPVPDAATLSEQQSLAGLKDYVNSQPAIFDMIQYNPVGDSHVDQIIEQAIAENVKQRNFGRFPDSESAVKAFGSSIVNNVWGRVLDDEAGRTTIESRILTYWTNPEIQKLFDGTSVEMNLGVVPGKISLNSQGYYTIPNSDLAERLELQPAELVRRLKQLLDNFPNDVHYRIIVITTPSYRDHSPLTYDYNRESDLLTIHKRPTLYRSPQPIGGLDRLVTGESPVHSSDLEIINTGRVGPPR